MPPRKRNNRREQDPSYGSAAAEVQIEEPPESDDEEVEVVEGSGSELVNSLLAKMREAHEGDKTPQPCPRGVKYTMPAWSFNGHDYPEREVLVYDYRGDAWFDAHNPRNQGAIDSLLAKHVLLLLGNSAEAVLWPLLDSEKSVLHGNLVSSLFCDNRVS